MIAGKDASRHGEAKNSWLTGTASWNFVTVSQYLLGVRADWDGLVVDPSHRRRGWRVHRAPHHSRSRIRDPRDQLRRQGRNPRCGRRGDPGQPRPVRAGRLGSAGRSDRIASVRNATQGARLRRRWEVAPVRYPVLAASRSSEGQIREQLEPVLASICGGSGPATWPQVRRDGRQLTAHRPAAGGSRARRV